MSIDGSVETIVAEAFDAADLSLRDIDVRKYPDETIIVVRVDEAEMASAIEVANRLDRALQEQGFDGFVTVKKADSVGASAGAVQRVKDLSDQRVADFVNLLTARSRTTELQPSLEYIPDARNHIATVKSPRHHLVFGRRGSGKTALLAETKRLVDGEGAITIWLNIQTYRHESGSRVFLFLAERFCQLIQSHYSNAPRSPRVVTDANQLLDVLTSMLALDEPDPQAVHRLIPRIRGMLRRFLETIEGSIYVFLDDFHYLDRRDQPLLLDMAHGCVRDCNAWLKVAAIQHLARWYEPGNQMGLQSGHDAASIDLDITLQDPSAAKTFLERMLSSYASYCRIGSTGDVFSKSTLDRLVLASGAVPRDYLTLCSTSVQEAQRRASARRVGVQDVNKAAGDAKQKKTDELEDDAAASKGESHVAIQTLNKVRSFCVEEKSWTYFRVDFREKESRMLEYGRLQMLADLRFVHLVEPSLSDEHRAGHRSEVYMLDLSQFAGQRLKRKLNVLDFVDGFFVLKIRSGDQQDRIGDTANRRLSLFRRAPLMELDVFSD